MSVPSSRLSLPTRLVLPLTRLSAADMAARLTAASVGLLVALFSTHFVQWLELTAGPVPALHRLFVPPTKLTWVLTWLVSAVAAFGPARLWVWRYLLPRWRAVSPTARVTLAAAAAAWAALTLVWWDWGLHGNGWVFPGGLRPVVQTAGGLAAWLALSAVAVTLLGLPIDSTAAPEPTPPAPAAWFRWRAAVVGWAAFAVLANGFAAWFVLSERAVYFWDYAGYWGWTADLAAAWHRSPANAWDVLRASTKYGGYNHLPAVAPGAVMAILGDHRLTYVLAVVNLYGLAVAAALTAAVRTVGRGWAGAPSAAASVVPLVALVGMPMLWAGTLRGMLDVGGVAIGLAVLAVHLSRPAGGLRWQHYLALAGLLAALSLFRRWYNFWVLAYLLVLAAETAVGVLAAWHRDGWRAAVARGRGAAAVPVLFLAGLATLAWPAVKQMAGADYAQEYVGYKLPLPFADRAVLLLEAIGWGPLLLAAAGGLVLLADLRTRRAAVVAGVMLPVMLVQFLKVHDPGLHHFGLYMPGLLLLAAGGLTRVALALPPAGRWVLLGALLAVAWLPVAAMFVPDAAGLRAAGTWLPRDPVYPLVRGDLSELRRLLADLDAATPPAGRVVVLSNSVAFNQTTLGNAPASLREPFPAVGRLDRMPEVDRRDGFPAALLTAAVAVVADPPQTHLRPEEQQTVVVPTRSLLAGTDVGAAFERLPGDYRLDGGGTVRLYRRTRPTTAAELADLCAKLRAAQPDFPKVWTPPE